MKGICQNCKKKSTIHKHHVVPRSQGGTLIVILCEGCHGKVHGRKLRVTALINEGLRKAKERGVKLGRPGRKYDINKAIKLYKSGLGVRKVATQLGISSGTMYNHLNALGIIRKSK